MKCTICGKEFGEGVSCRFCGVDRVTGLGNFRGYNSPTGSYEPHYNSSSNDGFAPNTTVCYACSEIIPKDSFYCPACGRQLWVECPKCGTTYSSQYKICSKCGIDRKKYHQQREEEKQRAIREEQERQRKQREWEQSPEGKAELARKFKEHERREKTKEIIFYLSWVVFFVCLFVCYGVLDSVVAKDWLSQEVPVVGQTYRNLLLTCISVVVSVFCVVVFNGIMEDYDY